MSDIFPITENRGSVTKTTTTRRIVQNQSYTAANGDEYAIPDVPGILQNPTFQSIQNGPKMDDSQGKWYDESLFPFYFTGWINKLEMFGGF